MTLHTLQIVDSIASSPTVRLDLNDGTTWRCTNFEAPPPRLRRAMSENAMRDGVHVSSSAYGARELALTLVVVSSTQDANATQLQTLARELDRTDNYLKWQPAGATKPVFFKLFRSDFESLLELRGQTAAREGVVRLLAEPFALGLRETLGPYTVNNDPAAGSNGCYVDLTGVIGDVAAPLVVANSSGWRTAGIIASRLHGTPSDLPFFTQAESVTLGTDTTNPGGGPDAAMSGTGTNNFARTSFATATMQTRLTWDLTNDINTSAKRTAFRGRYRVMAAVRRTNPSTGTINARVVVTAGVTQTGSTVTLGALTSRALVDFGVFDMSGDAPNALPYTSTQGARVPPVLTFQAERTSGTDPLDWDALYVIPADEQTLIWKSSESQDTALDMVLDGHQEQVYVFGNNADPFNSATTLGGRSMPIVGGLPFVAPNQTCRYYVMMGSGSNMFTPVTDTNALTFHYWPRYLYVRPSAT